MKELPPAPWHGDLWDCLTEAQLGRKAAAAKQERVWAAIGHRVEEVRARDRLERRRADAAALALLTAQAKADAEACRSPQSSPGTSRAPSAAQPGARPLLASAGQNTLLAPRKQAPQSAVSSPLRAQESVITWDSDSLEREVGSEYRGTRVVVHDWEKG